MISLEGRTAVVTGSSRGIGAEIARALDRAGARLCVTGRAEHSLQQTLGTLAHDPVAVAADLDRPEDVTRLARTALDTLGAVDILVNNAGIAGRKPVDELDASFIDDIYAINVRAPLLLVSALVPSMRARGGGSIVNLSSISGVVGTPRRSAYAASKGAIDAVTRALAAELGPDRIRVNSVAPGIVDGDAWAPFKTAAVVEQTEALTPLGRWATEEEVAQAVVFLASDAARFITGETLRVDGGIARTLDI